MFASIALKPLPVLPARKAASRGAACRATAIVRASVQRPAKVSLQAARLALPRPPPTRVRTANAAAGRRHAFAPPPATQRRSGAPDLYALIA